MGIENLGIPSFTPYMPADNKTFAGLGVNVPSNPAAPTAKETAKENQPKISLAPLPDFLQTPEADKPAPAAVTPAAVSTATESAEPIKIEFGKGSFSNVATTTAASTPAAATGTVVVSDAARSAAKSTLATIDAKLAQSGYSKPIGNQRDRTDAVNQVANGLRGEAKTKFLAEMKALAAPLGLNFGRRELDGGKAQYDKLSPEAQVIYNELQQEWKTGKVATPTPAAAEKTAPTPAPVEKTASTAKPAEKKAEREAGDIAPRKRSGEFTDRLNDLKRNDEAYAIAWARSLLPENSSRLDSASVTSNGSAGVYIANQPEVAAILKTRPTAEEFGRAMYKLANG